LYFCDGKSINNFPLRRTFVTNLFLLVFLNLLIKPFWILGIDRTVQNAVGAQQYGFYFALFNFSLTLNILLDLGITNFNNRNIAQNSQLIGKHFSNIVVLKLILALLYTLVCFVSAFVIGYHGKEFNLLIFMVLNQFLLSLTLYLRSNLSGLHLFKTDSIVSVLDRALMVLICSILLWGRVTEKPFKIEWFVYAQTLAYLITTVIVFLLTLYLPKNVHFKLKFDPKFFMVILKQSYPFAMLALLMTFYNRIDTVMLERLLPDGDEQAGIYAQSFRILDAVSMFSYLFAGLLLPMFARMIKRKESINQLLRLSFLLVMVPSVIVAVTSFVFRTEIITLMYHSHIQTSASIFGLLILGYISISTTYIFGTLLTANGALKWLNIMAGVGVIVNILLNLWLIPRFQAFGAAISSLVTQTFTAAIQVLLAKHFFKFRFQFKTLLSVFIFFVGVVLINIVCKDLKINWILSFTISTVLCVLLAFITKLLNLRVMIEILRNEE